MKSLKTKKTRSRSGMIIIIAMFFIALLTAVSVSTATMSTANAKIANNHKKANRALANSHSGLEVIRYALDGMTVPNSSVQNSVQSRLNSKNLTSISATLLESDEIINLSSSALNSDSSDNFSTKITMYSDRWQADITGTSGQLDRKCRAVFYKNIHGNPVFDFGVATKGPLLMTGQAELTGVNLAVESDVLIDTSIAGNSFEISNQASVEGNVHIVNSLATYDVGTKSEIGGETGDSAEDNIHVGVDPVEFPVPNTDYFRQFATGDTIDSSSTISNYEVLENVTVAANTNPTFASNITIKGVLFVEQPNNVTFAGKVTVQGVIVGDSLVGDDPNSNNFDFSGQVECLDVSDLEGAQFAAIKNETGSFLISPGFGVDFSGQSNIINGVIACSGARFTGQAGGVINGSIINYSTEPMVMQGQGSLSFNRSGTGDNPAGFVPVYTLDYDPALYEEIID